MLLKVKSRHNLVPICWEAIWFIGFLKLIKMDSLIGFFEVSRAGIKWDWTVRISGWRCLLVLASELRCFDCGVFSSLYCNRGYSSLYQKKKMIWFFFLSVFAVCQYLVSVFRFQTCCWIIGWKSRGQNFKVYVDRNYIVWLNQDHHLLSRALAWTMNAKT